MSVVELVRGFQELRLPLAPLDERLVEDALVHISTHVPIVGCCLAGSYGAGTATAASDIDLIFHCAATASEWAISSCVDGLSTLRGVKGVIPQGVFPWLGRCFTVISDGWRFSVDLGFVTDEDASCFPWPSTSIVLADSQATIGKCILRDKLIGKRPSRRIDPSYSVGTMAIYKGLKSCTTGEVFNAVEMCSQARRELIKLLRTRQGGQAASYFGRPERRIEQVLDRTILERLRGTFPRPASADVRRCLGLLAQWLVEAGDAMEFTSRKEAHSHRLLKTLLRESRFHNDAAN